MNTPEIAFFKLGIEIQKINRVAFTIFGIDIYWYSILIMIAVVFGYLLALHRAKISGQNQDDYSDFAIYGIITAVIGARLYYVAFAWDSYKDNLLEIFATRNGGLAIYGAVIGGILALILFAKFKELSFFLMADTIVPSLPFGQMVGRIGNFINKEAFGGYSDGLLSMSIKASEASYIPDAVGDMMREYNGAQYISVQPTFLYEGLWSLGTFIILMLYTKHKKFDGELFFLYMFLYGVGRGWIEGLRTDQLIIGNTGIPVSQLLAIIFAIASLVTIIVLRKKKADEQVVK